MNQFKTQWENILNSEGNVLNLLKFGSSGDQGLSTKYSPYMVAY